MKPPQKGDSIRIRCGDKTTSETCQEVFPDGTGHSLAFVVLTKEDYKKDDQYWLVGEGEERGAMIKNIGVPSTGGALKRVTFTTIV
jgi:hypothetical protein